MKKTLILITLFTCQFIISCNESTSDLDSSKSTANLDTSNKITNLVSGEKVTNLTKRNVGLASGVSFNPKQNVPLENNEFVVINPFNGKLVQSCGKTMIEEKFDPARSSPQPNRQCNNQIVEPSAELLNALKLTKPIKGKILKDNGQPTDAVFYVGVTAIYVGSHCTTLYLSGNAYTNCVKAEQEDPF